MKRIIETADENLSPAAISLVREVCLEFKPCVLQAPLASVPIDTRFCARPTVDMDP